MRRIVLPGSAKASRGSGTAEGAAAAGTWGAFWDTVRVTTGAGETSSRGAAAAGGVAGSGAGIGSVAGATTGAVAVGPAWGAATGGALVVARGAGRLVRSEAVAATGAAGGVAADWAAASMVPCPLSSQGSDKSGKAAIIFCTTSRLGLLRPLKTWLIIGRARPNASAN